MAPRHQPELLGLWGKPLDPISLIFGIRHRSVLLAVAGTKSWCRGAVGCLHLGLPSRLRVGIRDHFYKILQQQLDLLTERLEISRNAR